MGTLDRGDRGDRGGDRSGERSGDGDGDRGARALKRLPEHQARRGARMRPQAPREKRRTRSGETLSIAAVGQTSVQAKQRTHRESS